MNLKKEYKITISRNHQAGRLKTLSSTTNYFTLETETVQLIIGVVQDNITLKIQ